MPFGEVGKGEFGTYFCCYARSPRRIEQMLENIFIGQPPGNYDRLLDFSRAVTGTLFFVPSATFLEEAAARQPIRQHRTRPTLAARVTLHPSRRCLCPDGSLGIGSLKREAGKE